jgi:hypothetical protein
VLIGLGGLIVAVSPFLAWLHVVFFGDITLLNLLRLAGAQPALAWAGVAIGAGATITAISTGDADPLKAVGLSLGAIGLVASGYVLLQLSHDVSEAAGLANVGIGGWAAVAGSSAMLLGGILAR